jgi:poly(3-hydroxybutyrate) depolymerase
MAVEFVPGEKQAVDAQAAAEASADAQTAAQNEYTEISVQVGEEPYLLSGILTLPVGATADDPVPGVVLVHGSGPNDMDESIGQTKMFRDLAQIFARRALRRCVTTSAPIPTEAS